MGKEIDNSKHVLISWEQHALYEEAIKKLNEISTITPDNALIVYKKEDDRHYGRMGFYRSSFSYDFKIIGHNEIESRLKGIIDIQNERMNSIENEIELKEKEVVELNRKIILVKNELSGFIGRIFFKWISNKL
jgi:hypothetical protein